MRNTWNRYLIVIAILLLSGCGGTDRLTNTPPATIKVGEAYTYTPEFSLTAEEEALFTISNQPEWILFDPDTGTISGTPSNTDTGFYPDIEIQTVVELTILTTQPFSITVEEKGLSPQYTLLNTPPALVKENETYTYTPEFSSIEGEIVFTITNKPEWILFDTDTGKISGTPADIDIGTYSDITIQADTGNTTLTTEPFSITVEAINPQPQTSQVVDIPPTTDEPPTNSEPPTETPVNKPPTSEKPIPANKPPTSEKPTNIEPPAKAPENNPPTFTTVPKDTTIFIGDTYVFESKASDPDKDDSLTFSISGAPKGITVNPEIGKISGKPTDAGTYAMTLSVSDGKLKASTSFSITVNKKNSPPTFIKVPEDTTIFIGDTYAFEPKASDPDKDDSLTFSISGAPKGITVNQKNGTISGKPTDAGTYKVTLSVSDNSKLTASTPFSIMVNKKNLPPTIGGTPSKTTFYATR
ncbi:MAG: putative Ig domain-containing protein, partial [Gammaproteobacteria bacterium]|nr:putative Ig domain-containing protein [Gammaproteobacteria bacterium]